MTRRLHTEIEIQASPDRVWETLTEFAAYPDWNPFIVQAAGEPVPGGRLQLRMRLPGRRPMTFRPKVLEATSAHRLRWLVTLPTEEGFRLMNQALKNRVEHPSRAPATQ
jgi:hypothetical protein